MPRSETTSSKRHNASEPRREPASEKKILPNVQMRKQPPFLKNVADAPLMPRHRDLLLRIEKYPLVNDDPALLWGTNPPIMFTIVVLPAPERPNSAVNRPSD